MGPWKGRGKALRKRCFETADALPWSTTRRSTVYRFKRVIYYLLPIGILIVKGRGYMRRNAIQLATTDACLGR